MTSGKKIIRTHCGRMDHGGCALLVEVEDGRITGIKGDPEGLLNQGYICAKALASPRRLDHPRRLRAPLIREGRRGQGRWRETGWDEALGLIAGRLAGIRERHGARAVAFGAGMPKGLDHFALIRLANLFGSPNVVASQDVCHAPREITGLHTCGFYPVADLRHPTGLVLLWASNPLATNEEGLIAGQLLARLREGADLVVIDPHPGPLTEAAKLWLRPRPGSDAALALGFLHVVINEGLYDRAFVEQWTHGWDELAKAAAEYTPERVEALTWVPAEQVVEAARAYARARPAALAWGNPLEHTGQAFDAVRALILLMAICGNLDAPGGNRQAMDPDILGLGAFVRAEAIPDKRKTMLGAAHGVIPRMMTVPPAHFRRAVLTGEPYPVRAFYLMGANPLLNWADSRLTLQALNSLDFLAVSELFMTPTAALADVVLPAASHFEFDDMGHYGLGHGCLLARPRVVDPPPLCRPDLEILRALGKLVTPPETWPDDYHGLLQMVLAPSGLTYPEFCARGYLKGPDAYFKYRAKGFATPSGKVELALTTAEKFKLPPLPRFIPPDPDPDFPLLLTSRKSRFYLHSSYRWLSELRDHEPEPLAEMHPATAAAAGLGQGDLACIETPHGAMRQRVRLNPGLDPRVVYAAYGWWFPESDDPLGGWDLANYNLATSAAKLGRQFGTPDLKGLPCRVGKG